jgi:hypothetical protein
MSMLDILLKDSQPLTQVNDNDRCTLQRFLLEKKQEIRENGVVR